MIVTLAEYTRGLLGLAVTSAWLSLAASAIGNGVPSNSDGWQIPESAAAESNPEPNNAAVLAKGLSLYRAKCQRCHGVDGSGHGPDADPDHPAGNLTDQRVAARNPDGVLFYKIWNGRAKPKMPAMKVDLMRTDVWMIVQYVKTLRK
jgi:mono/diheme cytochrome c family protein